MDPEIEHETAIETVMVGFATAGAVAYCLFPRLTLVVYMKTESQDILVRILIFTTTQLSLLNQCSNNAHSEYKHIATS